MITLPEFLQVAIEISLFSFLGFLLYERLGSKVIGSEADSRRTIRKFARYYLASTFLLFMAYFLEYATGNAWLASLPGASDLLMLEYIAAFLGVVTMLFPLFPIFQVLGTDVAISDVILPELNRSFGGAIFILFYFGLLYLQTTGPQTLLRRIMVDSLIMGIAGIILAVFFAEEGVAGVGKKTKMLLFLWCMSPLIAIGVLVTASVLGFSSWFGG